MDVWDPLSCRACLVTDVKLFHLHDTGLADLFALITDSPVLPADGLPQSVCYYCYAQLIKIKKFRLKCQKTMTYFHDMVSAGFVESFDKIKHTIPLTCIENVSLDILPTDVDEYALFVTNIDTFNGNPIESIDNDDNGDVNDHYMEIDDEIKVKEEIDIEEVDIKFEINQKNEEHNISVSSHNLTEELEAAKTLKAKRKTKAIENKPTVKAPPKKKANRYNQKFEEELADFAIKHNLKVVCLSREDQLQQVEDRKNSEGFKNSRFPCNVCYKWFRSESAYNHHMKGHDLSDGSFVCDICQLHFKTKFAMNSHKRRHRKQFVCNICGQVNRTTHRAKLHWEWHEGVQFKCTECGKLFNASSTYMNHTRESHRAVSCADCGQSFLGTNELLEHTNVQHGNMKFKCEVCSVAFQSPEACVRHRADNVCHGKNNPCRHCGANFPLKTDLHAHIAKEHTGNGGMFTCDQCGALFSSERNLTAHVSYSHTRHVKHHSPRVSIPAAPPPKPLRITAELAHDDIRKRTTKAKMSKEDASAVYLCEVCAKSFTCPTKFKVHVQTHSDLKPFPCPVCGKGFHFKSTFKMHMNIHTGNRPFKCRLCPEAFKSYSQRYKHKLLVHSGERKHKCTLCDKTYVVSFDLKEHVRYTHLHHPRPPRKNPRKNSKAHKQLQLQ